MLGIVFTVLGAITIYRLWGDNTILVVIAVIATLYQLSSLREMVQSPGRYQPDDRFQTTLNMVSSLVIVVLLITSFVI